MTLNNATSVQNKAGVVVLNRINAAGTEQAAADREFIIYTGVSGNTLTGLTRNADSGSSDQDHAVGVIVEFIPDVLWAQGILDFLLTEHKTTGKHDDVTADTVDIGSSIAVEGTLDEDDMASDSAVKLATQQSIKAYSDKYAKAVGWTLDTDTWVYASASTFTIAGKDVTAKFTKGTKLKFTQTTVKYAVVVASSFSTDTTVTILVNTDHTIANAAISANYYSYQACPQGYPEWFALAAPTFAVAQIDDGAGGQPTVSETRARVDGKLFTCHQRGAGTKAASATYFSFADTDFPALANSTERSCFGSAYVLHSGTTDLVGALMKVSTDFYYVFPSMADNLVLTSFSSIFSYEI